MTASEGSAMPGQSAYAVADALLTKRGRSFHWARRLLSAPHAERATRLYGFCRRIDDIADDAVSAADAHAGLAAVRRALETGRTDDLWVGDMLQLMRGCGIDPAIPLELIRGVEGDLGDVRVADLDELLRYCYRVAGTVGLMMTAVLDVRAPAALPHAIDLGIAMQLTNICRDVREDALQGRRYLPATLVGPLDPAALVDPDDAVRATASRALRTLLDLADRFYASGEEGLRHLPRGARVGILVAARAYRSIGVVLRRRDYDCWSSRAVVGTARKTAITVHALIDTIGAGRVDGSREPISPSTALPPLAKTAWPTEVSGAD